MHTLENILRFIIIKYLTMEHNSVLRAMDQNSGKIPWKFRKNFEKTGFFLESQKIWEDIKIIYFRKNKFFRKLEKQNIFLKD